MEFMLISLLSLSIVIFFTAVAGIRRRNVVPTNWPFIGMLPGLLVNLHRLHEWTKEILDVTGYNIYFRGPWFLSMDMFLTSDINNVRHIFSTGHSNYPKGPEFKEIFDVLGDGIFQADGDSWRSQRRAIHSLFAAPGYRSFAVDCIKEKVEGHLVPLLDECTDCGEAIDLQDVFLRFALDIICRLVFGVGTGCLSPAFPSVPFAEAVDGLLEGLLFRHVVPPIYWKVLRLLKLGPERKFGAAQATIDEFIADVIRTTKHAVEDGRISSSSSSYELLSTYIRNPPKEVVHRISDEFLRDTVLTLLVGGRDTTAAALSWFFYLLVENPEAENKIIQELNQMQRSNSDSDDFDDINQLVYLHAAINEALRLFPGVPLQHRGITKPETLPSGHELRPGTKVLVSSYVMGRIESVWGKDCEEFKPERWITEDRKLKHEPTHKFFTFGSGPRICLGRDTTLMQMKIIAAAVIPKFRFEKVEGAALVEPKFSIILHMKNGMMVRATKRSSA